MNTQDLKANDLAVIVYCGNTWNVITERTDAIVTRTSEHSIWVKYQTGCNQEIRFTKEGYGVSKGWDMCVVEPSNKQAN